MSKKELKILVGLHRNVNALDRKTLKLVAEYGLTFRQFMVLEALYSKGDMTVGEMRDKILSSIGTIPLIINNLEKLNYVQRLPDKTDKRVSILHLTKEGYEIISKVAPENAALITESMSVLTEKEKTDLLYLLKKLGGRIDAKNSEAQSKRN